MAENALWFALGCAFVAGLFLGPKASAWPLVASGFLGQWLDSKRVFDDWRACIAVDLATASLIYRKNMARQDKIILALFAVAAAFYAMPDPWRYRGTLSVVVLQLLLTIPLTKLQGIGGFVSHGPIREVKYEGAR